MTTHFRFGASLVLMALALPVMGQSDPDRAVTGNGKFPAGWSARPDRGTADSLVFTQAGDVLHFTMGSAGTFYRADFNILQNERATIVAPPRRRR